jgi:signal transduction histidine kinase
MTSSPSLETGTPEEPQSGGADAMPNVTLDDILITAELSKRATHKSRLDKANAALQSLAQEVGLRPADVLSRFVEIARQLCAAGSAGISVYEAQPGSAGIFRWHSLAGKAAPFAGETTPRDFSPCGICLDKGEPILMQRPGRYYGWFNLSGLPVNEALLVPLFLAGRKPFGTLWLMSHDDKQFDQDDAVLLSAMATFLVMALGLISQLADKDAALKQAEERLRQSSKLATLGLLAGEVAHDFNNLLTVLSSQLELIRLRVEDDKVKRMAELGLTATTRADQLVQQILSFARRRSFHLDVIDVEKVLAEIIATLHHLASSLNVERRIAPGLWPLRTDENQLLLAILNLAVNARDAMPEGGSLTIDVRNAASTRDPADAVRPGDFVALAISDTGTGMSAETLKSAFEPFFTTKAEGRGTGLGLSMVAGFVEQSGGTVRIVSELGRGTTVTIYLPRAAPEVLN